MMHMISMLYVFGCNVHMSICWSRSTVSKRLKSSSSNLCQNATKEQ